MQGKPVLESTNESLGDDNSKLIYNNKHHFKALKVGFETSSFKNAELNKTVSFSFPG